MKDFRIAACQFEPKSLDVKANLGVVREMTAEAASGGAQAVFFHEQCLMGYNMWGEKGREPGMPPVEKGRVSPEWQELGVVPADYAEEVPDGPSTQALIALASEHEVVIGAGLPEASSDNSAYNTYAIVGPYGLIGRYRKVHLVPGSEDQYFRKGNDFPVFDIGWTRMGVLICYDNHFPEAHRVLAVRGAQLIVMPHVTVGRGWWKKLDDVSSFEQARKWILTWCRARAFDNSAYVVFVNQGSDDPSNGAQGCSMILDPDGHVISGVASPGREIIYAECSAEHMAAVRHRTHDYLKHRRPELYGPVTDPHIHIDPY